MTYINTANFQHLTREGLEEIIKEEFPYPTFQGGQDRAIFETCWALLVQGKKHVIIDAPTGVGKTAIAYTVHKVISRLMDDRWRTTISTTTKGLQDQYTKDFTEIADLRGKTNYPCPIGAKHYNTLACKLKVADKSCYGDNCPYLIARRTWCNMADIRVTNSAMIVEMCPLLCMMEHNYAPLLVIDECHKLPTTILDHTVMEFSYQELELYVEQHLPGAETLLEKVVEALELAQDWAPGKIIELDPDFIACCKQIHSLCEGTLSILEKMIKDESIPYIKVERINDCILFLQRLSDYSEICYETEANKFVVHEVKPRQFNDRGKTEWYLRLKPIFAKDVADFAIYRKNEYFIHMSATICGAKKYAFDMGIPEDELHVVTLDNPIPVENRPINYIPVGSMNASNQARTLPEMARAISELAREHEFENGLIHVSSYKLAEDLIKLIDRDVNGRFVVGRNQGDIVQGLKYSADNRQHGFQGAVYVTPCCWEGVDGKGDLLRWQAIAKIPFGFLGDELVKYMSQKDKGWYIREVVLQVVQACGRPVRGVNDSAVTYILDSGLDNVIRNGSEFLPDWWTEALTQY